MRIAGNKPDPTNLADIVSSMDSDASDPADTAGFVDDVVTDVAVGIPPEVVTPTPVPPEPVVTSPLAQATKKVTERRGRKPKGIPATAKPLGPALTSPDEMNDPPPASEPEPPEVTAAVDEVVEELKKKPVIEHGIPIPAHGNVGAVRYPFREMKKGDSFFVRQEPGESRKKLSARVRSASAQFRRRSTGEVVSFTTRMEKNGIRVWRLT